MKNQLLLIPLLLLLCFIFTCQKQDTEATTEIQPNLEADIAAIKLILDEWVQLYNAGDFDKLMSIFYAENSVLMSPNVSIRKGKEAILLGYQKARESDDEQVDSSVVEDVRVSGDLAVARGIDTGTSTPKSGGKPVHFNLKWLIVFERKSDGIWKCIYEIWNDNPVPGTPEKG